MSNNSVAKKRKRLEIQERLLRLFDGDEYEEFHTPKYVFVKHWNGDTGRWQVAIYPMASWEKLKRHNDLARQQQEHLRGILMEE